MAVLLDARMVRQPSDSPLLARHSFVRGATVTLTASPANATTYQWQRDGVDIPGATAVDYVASVTGSIVHG